MFKPFMKQPTVVCNVYVLAVFLLKIIVYVQTNTSFFVIMVLPVVQARQIKKKGVLMNGNIRSILIRQFIKNKDYL